MNYSYILNDLSIEELTEFYGIEDSNIKYLEKKLDTIISGTGSTINIIANNDTYIELTKVFEKMIKRIKNKEEINKQVMDELLKNENIDESIKFVVTNASKVIKPKNESQCKYYRLLEEKTIVFAMGAAGTGKTYLAVCYACNLLKQHKISKIVVTRPIVEAGENLGFLPGELKEKVDPYLIPIYDSFYDVLGKEMTDKYIERGVIEIAPLAYMRGRTLSDSFVILDEAQNTTSIQMKMFLTRLGYNSKMVITGDESQIDLKPSIKSGIVVASDILKNIDEIAIIHFMNKDVVRNPLVSKIIDAYSKYENN